MIAKVPPKRRDGRSSFKSLGKYADRERDHIDPITGEVEQRQVSVETNCLFRETAWREMKAVADMNGRVKDSVYHFTVSWPHYENPTDKQMFAVGRAGMKAIGMEKHQYLAAVHRDTDQAHVHVMVNRIDPETYRSVYPSRDFFKLDKCMREMELEQGWSHSKGPYAVFERDGKKVVDWAVGKEVRRQQQRQKLPGKARQMEVMSGNESLASYAQGAAKKEALEVLRKGGNWRELHKALEQHGLEIKPKGQGLAIYSKKDPEQAPIKASTMTQELGAGKLTRRLGQYKAPTLQIKREEPEQEYSSQRPKRDPNLREAKRNERAAEREKLRSRYQTFANEWKAARVPAKSVMYEAQKEQQREITEEHKAKREEIRKEVGLSVMERKALYSVVAMETASKRRELREKTKAEREAFRLERVQSYREWVIELAERGEIEAIRQLRGWAYADRRKAKKPEREKAVSKEAPYIGATDYEERDPAKPKRISERITWSVDRKTGDVDYKIGDRVAFRDSGRRLEFTDQGARERAALEAGLLLAREKFGQSLEVRGSKEFKEKVLRTAIEKEMDVRFADPEMEQLRAAGLRKQIERRPSKEIGWSR
jgi:hypothetical protein